MISALALSLSLRLVGSRAALQVEILALRHQFRVLERSRPRRVRLTRLDRLLWLWLSCTWTEWRAALVIVKPETVIGWHRQGLSVLDVEKSPSGGSTGDGRRPRADSHDVGDESSLACARIHGASETRDCRRSIQRGEVHGSSPPALVTDLEDLLGESHRADRAADFFVVPTATCRLLFVLVMLAQERRRVVHIGATDHPTAAWTHNSSARRFPRNEAFLLRDRGSVFMRGQ